MIPGMLRTMNHVRLKGLITRTDLNARILACPWPVLNLEFCTVLPIPACTTLAFVFLNQYLNVECTIKSFMGSWFVRRANECRGVN
jgi:hypothetical protein